MMNEIINEIWNFFAIVGVITLWIIGVVFTFKILSKVYDTKKEYDDFFDEYFLAIILLWPLMLCLLFGYYFGWYLFLPVDNYFSMKKMNKAIDKLEKSIERRSKIKKKRK